MEDLEISSLEYCNTLNIKSQEQAYQDYINITKSDFGEQIPAVRFDIALFLEQLIMIKQPTAILEIGFGSGVSSYFLQKSSFQSKIFISLEKDLLRFERGMRIQKNNLVLQKITILNEDALKYIQDTELEFDFVFIDAAKKSYKNYLELITPKVLAGGLVITDNILFNNKVLMPEENIIPRHQKLAQAIKNYNEHIAVHTEYQTSFYTIGDGVAVSIKK